MPRFTHVEISTADLERSAAFYGGLFGWKVEKVMETYWMLDTGESPGAGLSLVCEVPERGATRVYVTVESIEESLARAAELGGVLVDPRTGIGGGYGAYAHVRDPGGAVIGLHESA